MCMALKHNVSDANLLETTLDSSKTHASTSSMALSNSEGFMTKVWRENGWQWRETLGCCQG